MTHLNSYTNRINSLSTQGWQKAWLGKYAALLSDIYKPNSKQLHSVQKGVLGIKMIGEIEISVKNPK